GFFVVHPPDPLAPASIQTLCCRDLRRRTGEPSPRDSYRPPAQKGGGNGFGRSHPPRDGDGIPHPLIDGSSAHRLASSRVDPSLVHLFGTSHRIRGCDRGGDFPAQG